MNRFSSTITFQLLCTLWRAIISPDTSDRNDFHSFSLSLIGWERSECEQFSFSYNSDNVIVFATFYRPSEHLTFSSFFFSLLFHSCTFLSLKYHECRLLFFSYPVTLVRRCLTWSGEREKKEKKCNWILNWTNWTHASRKSLSKSSWYIRMQFFLLLLSLSVFRCPIKWKKREEECTKHLTNEILWYSCSCHLSTKGSEINENELQWVKEKVTDLRCT